MIDQKETLFVVITATNNINWTLNKREIVTVQTYPGKPSKITMTDGNVIDANIDVTIAGHLLQVKHTNSD